MHRATGHASGLSQLKNSILRAAGIDLAVDTCRAAASDSPRCWAACIFSEAEGANRFDLAPQPAINKLASPATSR